MIIIQFPQTRKYKRFFKTSFNLDKKAKVLIEPLKENLFQNPPSYEKLVGDMDGLYSRRINIKYSLVYQVYEENN